MKELWRHLRADHPLPCGGVRDARFQGEVGETGGQGGLEKHRKGYWYSICTGIFHLGWHQQKTMEGTGRGGLWEAALRADGGDNPG